MISKTLECEPRRWKIIEHVREKFSCRDCEAITEAPAPSHPIPRGFAGPTLLAMVLVNKFLLHQPLNRQSKTFAREGTEIDVSTLADRSARLVQEDLNRDPHAGDLYVFRGRRGDLIKIIWHDGQGACLFTKRLERGRFLWSSLADGVVTISVAQISYLLSGIDWRMPRETWRPQATG